jgi:hypothetical protein
LKKHRTSTRVVTVKGNNEGGDTMLSLQHEESQDNFKDNFVNSRLNELMSRYEDPVRAIVHQTLEEYVEKAFTEFMEGRIGTILSRASDGKAVTEYRNGSRDVKQGL